MSLNNLVYFLEVDEASVQVQDGAIISTLRRHIEGKTLVAGKN